MTPGGQGDTVEVGLIGAGIGGSLSPVLHEREAALLGFDYTYTLLDLDDLDRLPEDIGPLIRDARDAGLRGLNVTHPCKQLVIDALDDLAPAAAAVGAVNTVVLDRDRSVGHNTDGSGFQEAFARGLPDVEVERVALIGAGGAGTALAHALLDLGAGYVIVLDADLDRARGLAEALTERFGVGSATAAAMSSLHRALAWADGLVHATPTGMTGHPGSAVPRELLDRRHWVADVVYMPIETQLLADARARGCRTLDGTSIAHVEELLDARRKQAA
jgi:shikimate dehydrogenase